MIFAERSYSSRWVSSGTTIRSWKEPLIFAGKRTCAS